MSGGTPGYTQTFTDIKNGAVFSYYVSRGCTSPDQSVSVKYNVNGTKINRSVKLNDNGASQKALNAAVKTAFATLPGKFQNGLKEIYLFCSNATPCLSFPAKALHAIKVSTPYTVQQFIDKRPGKVDAFMADLNAPEE